MTTSEIKTIAHIVAAAFHDEETYNHPQPITPEEAAATLDAWTEDGIHYPDSLTPVLFANAWNVLCDSRVSA